MIPKFPIFFAITLSSNEFNPNVLDYLTSFRHLPHLCTAYFVRPIRKGIRIILITPKTRMPKIASKYPRRFVS